MRAFQIALRGFIFPLPQTRTKIRMHWYAGIVSDVGKYGRNQILGIFRTGYILTIPMNVELQ